MSSLTFPLSHFRAPLLVQALHDIRVLHRDMKSANVFLHLSRTDLRKRAAHREYSMALQGHGVSLAPRNGQHESLI